MSSERSVILPIELLEIMTIEKTFFTPENPHQGIIILTETEIENHIVHIYKLTLSSKTKQYNIVQELAAFIFMNRPDVDDFIERIPNMSALEMLMLLNPLDTFTTNMN